MKKFLMLVTLTLGLAACASAPTPDPDNGVSNASYRQCIERSETNVAQIVSQLLLLRDLDQKTTETHLKPLRGADFWDAEILQAQVTVRFLSDTLKGSTK